MKQGGTIDVPWTKAAGAQRSHVGHLRAADSNATGERVLGESEVRGALLEVPRARRASHLARRHDVEATLWKG